MRLILLSILIASIVAGIVWLSAGRWTTAIADGIFTIPIRTPPVNKLAFHGEGFRIGDLSLTFGALDNQRSDVQLCTNTANRIVLKSGGRSFVLGPRTNPADTSGRPDLDWIPEPGDEVSLTAARSLIGWPTPFEINWMTRTPSWKRYVTYRLTWKKRSGAELTMRWRYEQDYYRGSGWTRPMMMWNWYTGLQRTEIQLASKEKPREG
jgi:hypothetical protein